MSQPELGKYRRVPFASEVAWFPMTLTFSVMHLFCTLFKTITGLDIEPALSCLVAGGLFGLVLIPLSLLLAVIASLDALGLVPYTTAWTAIQWLTIPFSVYYFVTILILDRTHLSTKDSNPFRPRNAVEDASRDFFVSALDYFPMTCVPWDDDDKAELPTDNNEQYVFGVHPHGIHCFPLAQLSTHGSAFDQRFPGLVGTRLTGLAATVLFKLPVVRELFIIMGYVDASRTVASKVLENGRSFFVCTGGEEESMYTSPGKDIVVLKRRKGFVRLALSYGATLVPVFGVPNTDLYTTYHFLTGPRLWLQKTFGVALPIFHGRWGTPLPYRKEMKVLIGKPISTPKPKVKGERPDEKLVDEYHSKYIASLQEIYTKHVPVGERTLEIR